jgi:hypothetical protein
MTWVRWKVMPVPVGDEICELTYLRAGVPNLAMRQASLTELSEGARLVGESKGFDSSSAA